MSAAAHASFKRLCVISHPCFRSVNRGVYKLLRRNGIDVTLIVPARLHGENADSDREGDLPIHYLPLSSESPRSYYFRGAEAVLDANQPQLVMIEADPLSRLTLRTGAWCRRHGARLACLSVENLDFGFAAHLRRTGISSLPQVAAKTMLHLWARKIVDQVFTINSAGTELFRRHGYKRVTEVPLGFDPATFRVDASARARVRMRFMIAENAVVLGYFGRLTPQKGVHHIIDALGRIAARNPATKWHLMMDHFQADDGYTEEIKKQIERVGLGPRVLFFDADHQEIAHYMAATDVVVLASLSSPNSIEQYGRVIPEAMACGALAVVSNSGAPKELVGQCGLVLQEGDVDALTETLSAIISMPEKYRPIAAAGAKRASAKFSIVRQAEIYQEAFAHLVEAPY